ncbi:MAG: ABC transporter permease subunit [Alphaproteobacteria bacterium]|nr:ABC transporter permease subunit [Alphaproteobacteria bacterium]
MVLIPIATIVILGYSQLSAVRPYLAVIDVPISVVMGLAVAVAVTVASLFIAAAIRWARSPFPMWAYTVFLTPAAIPPLLLAFGYAGAANIGGVQQGPVLVAVAQFVVFLPLGVFATLRRVTALSDDLIPAAVNLGVTPISAILTVVAPQIMRELVLIATAIFILGFSDAVFTLFLAGPTPTFGQVMNGLSLGAANNLAFAVGIFYVCIVVFAIMVGTFVALLGNARR